MRASKIIVLVAFLLSGSVLLAQGIEELATHPERITNPKSISIYPNPAVDYVDVNLDNLPADKIKLTVYNIIGNEIQVESEVIDPHKIRLRVKEFAAGYYLVALRDEETNFKGTYKFLKR